MKKILIAALSDDNVIGRKGELPWYLPEDLKRFSKLTRGHEVIMGRKTFESILARIGKPLPDRINIVITRQPNYSAADCIITHTLEDAYAAAKSDKVFVIGGGEIYRQALATADMLYLTQVHISVPDGDAFFPKINEAEWRIVERVDGNRSAHDPLYEYLTYERIVVDSK